MKTVFFGTPQFAIAPLKALYNSRHSIVAIVSQPDRAKDRKGNLIKTPVRQEAERLGIPVYQFESVKTQGIEILKNLDADIFITAAYGQILNQEILDIPRCGVINIHASLLPLYRGCSPVQQAILDGQKSTGITIMQTRLAMDAGEIILQKEIDILDDDDCESLMDRLSNIGAELLLSALDNIECGQAKLIPQDESKATYCKKITGDLRCIDWTKSAQEIHNVVRAVGGLTSLDGQIIKVLKTKVIKTTKEKADKEFLAGEVVDSKRLIVSCGSGQLEILRLTPQGSRQMSGKDFLLGKKKERIKFEQKN